MRVLACIPARYGSTRFPGKVLAKDTGRFLIQHTYERTLRARRVDQVLIATDSNEVRRACESFGATCVMTSADHQSGTDRIAEAVADIDVGVVVNVQADEPEIDPGNIDYVAELLLDRPDCSMATLVARFRTKEKIGDPNMVKVIVDSDGNAICFSRSVIPFDRDAGGVGHIDEYLRHVGTYAYRKEFLLRVTSWPQTSLERTEKLEQLRVIENGFHIFVGKVEHTCDGIDTPQQYAEFVKRYNRERERVVPGSRNVERRVQE